MCVALVSGLTLGATGLRRVVALTAGIAALLSLSACRDSVTGAEANGNRPIRFGLAPTINAAPGAVLEGTVTYVSRGSVLTLGRDSVIIPSTPSSSDAVLSLAANVSVCLDEAAAAGTDCNLSLTLRLTRNGTLLDESIQTVTVTRGTEAVTVPAVTLYEVSTVQLTPATITAFEPGDTQTLTATARDRNGVVVADRTPLWELVSGGVTISTSGVLTAVTPGPARVRATVGGRSTELVLTVGQPSVASITLAPVDTLIVIGTTATIRTTVLSTTGQSLTGRPLTFVSSTPAVATISATGVVTGVAVGATTITVRSTEGRNGATVTATVPLRVEAAPPIFVDKPAVSLDSLVPGTSSAITTVAVTTVPGKRIAGLRTAVSYQAGVTPWLTATINPTATPATLTLQANAGALAPGIYLADAVISSSTDPHVPVAVRVTLEVVAARRVALAPRIVDFGTFSSSVTSAPPVTVAVTSPTGVALSGLAATVQYTSSGTGWISAALSAPSAAPSTTLQLTPIPFGLPDGTYTARVVVSSTTFGAAPDTVNVSLTIAPSGRFAGQLVSGGSAQPVAGATVTIRRASDNVVVDVQTTASDGRFTSTSLGAGTYNLTFVATGFVTTTYTGAILTGNSSVPVTTLPSTLLAPNNAPSGILIGEVRDATNNNALAGVTVQLRAGANNTVGTALQSATTNANGSYSFTPEAAGTYTVLATRSGYAASSVTTVISSTSNSAPLLFISPGAGNAVWRFVLSWGKLPTDLDAHLTGPVASSSNRFHVYFGSRGSATLSPFAVLDVDQTDGLGPETITIAQQTPGIYRYYVDNFSEEVLLSASNARVDVYLGNTLVNQFFVPSQPGVIWNVFEINGTTLTPINTNGNVAPAVRSDPSAASSTTVKGSNSGDDLPALFSRWRTKPPVR